MREPEPVVIIHQDQEIEHAPARREPRPDRSLPRWPSRTGGVVLTALVHLLISSPFVLGTAAHKQRTSPDGTGSTAWASRGEQNEAMLLLDLSAMASNEEMQSPLTSPAESALTEELKLLLVSSQPSPPPDVTFEEDETESDEANEAAGDPRGSAVLFGKYVGQVAARIERAWMRPRAPIDSGQFDCRAHVTQDRGGNVLAVNLENCSDDPAWRRSLESAILRASPLSAPPEPELFTAALSLDFSADQYQAGVTPDYLYEPAPVRVAAAVPLQIFTTTDESRQRTPVESASGDVELTITGSQVTWKKKSSVTTQP